MSNTVTSCDSSICTNCEGRGFHRNIDRANFAPGKRCRVCGGSGVRSEHIMTVPATDLKVGDIMLGELSEYCVRYIIPTKVNGVAGFEIRTRDGRTWVNSNEEILVDRPEWNY